MTDRDHHATATADWAAYLAGFHAQRAGITEDVLEHVHDGDSRTPYDWAAEPVAPGLTVLDLACGSAPMHARLRAASYVGVDLSAAELIAAAARRVPVARGDASRLPLPDAAVDAVVMSMALMLVPLAGTLAEVARVLRPGGVFVATVPVGRPLPPRDLLRYGRLFLALRTRGLAYPNDAALRDVRPRLASAGLRLVCDQVRPYTCDLRTAEVAERLLDSLYLPDVEPARIDVGRRVVRRWVGTAVATPIRRLVATQR